MILVLKSENQMRSGCYDNSGILSRALSVKGFQKVNAFVFICRPVIDSAAARTVAAYSWFPGDADMYYRVHLVTERLLPPRPSSAILEEFSSSRNNLAPLPKFLT